MNQFKEESPKARKATQLSAVSWYKNKMIVNQKRLIEENEFARWDEAINWVCREVWSVLLPFDFI